MLDFKNTEIAFGGKTNAQLRKAYFLFSMMNKAWLVRVGSSLGLWAMRWQLPIAPMVRYTMFAQFCGGENLDDCQPTADDLHKNKVLAILDYGAEAKESEADFDFTMRETMRAIDLGAKNTGKIPVVSTKFTGMARFYLLEKLHAKTPLTAEEQVEYQRSCGRLEAICKYAAERNIGVFVDAEESWIQQPIDDLVEEMMRRYNRERVTIYNTYQLYLHSRLPYLYASATRAKEGGYLLGAKLVRGAYMEKERKRAAEQGYESPVQPDKAATDRDYNAAVRFVVDNYQLIGSCVASHNEASTRLQADLMRERNIPLNHPHLNFCQLYGMSDHLTFNLGHSGYNSSKYVVYGQVRDVFPYLVRRAQENSSISGDMSRELSFIDQEMKRRKLI
jgi:proline dehydrogenase